MIKRYAKAIAHVEFHLDEEHSPARTAQLEELAENLREALYDMACEECRYRALSGWDDEYVDYDEAREKMKASIKEAKEALLYERKYRRARRKKTA